MRLVLTGFNNIFLEIALHGKANGMVSCDHHRRDLKTFDRFRSSIRNVTQARSSGSNRAKPGRDEN
jgi:hypothetical protein